METSSLCRICLAADLRMHSIVAGELQEMYESLSMTPLETKDKRPTQACYICFSRLKNCYQLKESCVRSEQLLTEILSGGLVKPVELLQNSSSKLLQIRPVEYTGLEHEADSCRGMDYVYELKRESADTEVFEVDQLADKTVDTVKVLVKKEPSERNADIAVEQDDADVYHSALGLHTECDIPLDIVKEEPDDVDTGTPRLAAQTYRKDTLLNSLKKTDQTMFKVEEPSGETKPDIVVKPIKIEKVETRDNIDIVYNNKQNNSASDQNDAHKEMSENIIIANQSVNSSSSSKLKRFLCDTCQKCFNRKYHLKVHIRIHTGEKPYVCNVCKQRFIEKRALERHTRMLHTGEKPYVCNVCKKCFIEKRTLERHARSHTGEKPHVCNVCKKCFVEKRTLEIHTRMHTGEKPYVCNVCEKCFTEKRYLKNHSHTHTGEKPYVCAVCQKYFSKKSSLKVHIRTHAGEKPYMCNVCKKGFTQKESLESHTRTHTGEKPYVCNICKKSFTVKGYLEKHTRTHTGEKPYVCNTCKKCFAVKSTLDKHTRTHTGEKPYECIVCRKCFRNKSHLTRHISIHTGENPLV